MFAGIADKDWSTHVPEVAAAHCPHLLHMTWIIQRDQQVFSSCRLCAEPAVGRAQHVVGVVCALCGRACLWLSGENVLVNSEER